MIIDNITSILIVDFSSCMSYDIYRMVINMKGDIMLFYSNCNNATGCFHIGPAGSCIRIGAFPGEREER